MQRAVELAVAAAVEAWRSRRPLLAGIGAAPAMRASFASLQKR
jgi:hypothetical protein